MFLENAFENGARTSLVLFKSRSAPHEKPLDFSHEYRRERAALRVSRALQRPAGASFLLGAALEAEDLFIERRGQLLREDRLRVLEAAVRGGWRGEGAVQYSSSLALRRGLDALGAGLDAPFLPNDPRRVDFLLAQISAGASRRFAIDWSIRIDLLAQHSNHVLPDSERFKIGGDRLGRGFEVAEIAGDRGAGGKLELRRDLAAGDGMFGRLSAYGFYDAGAAWKQDIAGRESATTGGAGFALQGPRVSGYVEVAAPLSGTDIEGRRGASLFAELSYRF
jgi:hemolysin activation/secretion protein